MIEQLRESFEKIILGIDTYQEIYPDADVPDRNMYSYSIEANISIPSDNSISFNWETEVSACSRGCCGYETHYYELVLPVECITNPEKWKIEERARIKEAEEKAEAERKVQAEIARQKREEATEKKRLAKIEEDKALLEELKAKYEG